MKALQVQVDAMVRRERINQKHTRNFMRGHACKRFPDLTFNDLVAAMAALGHVTVCRLVKAAADYSEYRDSLKKAMAA